uniref:Uncharacterized protein n=1 Tax=Arundo donax TaxID=35708 RepID=A0A0A9C502_ARUDO
MLADLCSSDSRISRRRQGSHSNSPCRTRKPAHGRVILCWCECVLSL